MAFIIALEVAFAAFENDDELHSISQRLTFQSARTHFE